MFLAGLNRLQFLLVSFLILAVEVVGVLLVIHFYLGWQGAWYLEHSAARGNATLVILMLFAVMVVVRIIAAMLRLRDAGVSVWFALPYGFPLLFGAFFDAMVFAMLVPVEHLWTPVLWRLVAFAIWLAILLVPSSGVSVRTRARKRAGEGADSGPGVLPERPDLGPVRRQPLAVAPAASSRSFGKRRS